MLTLTGKARKGLVGGRFLATVFLQPTYSPHRPIFVITFEIRLAFSKSQKSLIQPINEAKKHNKNDSIYRFFTCFYRQRVL